MNSEASIRTGRRLVRRYGSWGEVLKHAVRSESGDYQVSLEEAPKREDTRPIGRR